MTDLGETWTPDPGSNEVHDRIDIVYYRGDDVSLQDVLILGENAQNADIVVSPWPSDHRAVVATFQVPEPGSAPVLLSGTVLLGLLGRRRAARAPRAQDASASSARCSGSNTNPW